jgi:mRNA-degrading endonuclease RelE of RelBE toxin-antitoxin system
MAPKAGSEPRAAAGETKSYEIRLTDEAVYAYADVMPDEVYERMGDLITFLAEHPYYGGEYDPYYKASKPPVDCRVFYCASYGVYYHVDEEEAAVTVFAIVDTRRNPLRRFSGIDFEWTVGE